MYELARKTRADRRAKAERLGASTERKTDSSDWTPAEPLNADAKTGMRPVSRRAYKSGGKVEGCGAKANMGRKARKSGGAADSPRSYANAKINRNAKDANEERAGVKHIGGLKTGGRAKKEDGGSLPKNPPLPPERPKDLGVEAKGDPGKSNLPQPSDVMTPAQVRRLERGRKHGGRTHKADGGSSNEDKTAVRKIIEDKMRSKRTPYENDERGPTESAAFTGKRNIFTRDDMTKAMRKTDEPIQRKAGGRAKKADGGENVVERATKMLDKSAKTAGVPGATMTFGRIQKGAMSPARAVGVMKNGGKTEKHSDEAMDKALIKKMVKKEARTGKAIGGAFGQYLSPALMAVNAIRGDKDEKKSGGRIKRKDGGSVESRTVHKTDGEFHYPEKDYGQLASTSAFTRKVQDRTPLKTGGRAKNGKTDINIIIATGAKPGQQDGMMPPPGMDMGLPPGLPVPVPGAASGAAAPAPMAMPMPMPMPSGGAPAGAPAPMPRKRGGRAMSFKDMTAGAGSGEGRLQKTDIAEYKREKRRAGGKVYKSYQDMDAGAGSGLGRLEKTEIQSRKR